MKWQAEWVARPGIGARDKAVKKIHGCRQVRIVTVTLNRQMDKDRNSNTP